MLQRLPATLTRVWTVGPDLGQVEGPVHQGVALAGGVSQVDRDLAVLDPPGRAGVLTLHPDRGGAVRRA